RPFGSVSEAPLAKVTLTTCLYVSPVQTIPARDQTGTPSGLPGLAHLTSSTMSGSASCTNRRTVASTSARQSPSERMRSSTSCEAGVASTRPPTAPGLQVDERDSRLDAMVHSSLYPKRYRHTETGGPTV